MTQTQAGKRDRRRKAGRALMAALVGSSVLISCDARIQDALIRGTEQFILGLFNPANPDGLASLLLPDSDA